MMKVMSIWAAWGVRAFPVPCAKKATSRGREERWICQMAF